MEQRNTFHPEILKWADELMSECEYCFCRDGEPHHEKCPVVNESTVHKINGLTPGTLLDHGRYKVGMALNHGGFGIAYICKDLIYERRIVIKEFFPDKYSDRDTNVTNTVAFQGLRPDALYMMQAQFYREYDIMTKAACRGIPAVYGFFIENGTAYIAMDFIPGGTFKNYLQNYQKEHKEPMPWWELRRKFFVPLMRTVEEIHRKKILHRDISLVNLMITPDEKIVLLDFGAGRDFHESDTVEKLRFANKLYAPIEQTNPEHNLPQGPWTDIFAMGTVFYAAITGHYPPMALERPQKAVDSAIEFVPDLPTEIDDALLKALYYYPKHRFQNVQDFRRVLMACPDPPPKPKKTDWWQKVKNLKKSD